MALLSPGGTRWLAVVLVGVLAVLSLSFVLTPASGERLQPAAFDDTVTVGGTGIDIRRSEEEGFVVPKAQVYFSNYRYVVGYYGVSAAASELSDSSTTRQFGTPLAVFVSDFSRVEPSLTAEGFVVPEQNRAVGWVTAEDAHFVVGSEARVPSGPVVLGFSDREDADRFAAAHGGRVVDWEGVQRTAADPLDERLEAFRNDEAARDRFANRTVAAAEPLFDRPRSVVVGDDAPTVAAAVADAPPDTTVYLPPGTYRTDGLVVNRSITLAGAGEETVLRGDGNGSVVHAKADRVGVANLRIDGVGTVGSRGPDRRDVTTDWDTSVQLAYGYGDAGIVLDGSNGSAVSGARIETNASGILVRGSDRTVVEGVTVDGAPTPEEGFMGAILIDGRSVVENSTFRGGRDGVYTHRADGSVVRRNRMVGGRYGVHEMYTSNTLVADNTVRDAQSGVIVMTRPVGNIVVGNDVRDSTYGVVPAGGESLYADNVVVNNGYGLQVAGDRNAFVGNVVVGNRVGVRGNEILPTNWAIRNDVVDNDRRVEVTLGPTRTWTHGGVGNHWGELPLTDADSDGVYDRTYRPSGAVDGRLGETPGATTLARSPAATTLRGVQDVVSGLRQSGVVDSAPRTSPFRPAAVERARANATDGGETA
ncbi:Nitrous oxidase accessory protein NosD, contains tandem CASH domains [Halopelagius inordinatus]|uniref:Nitrous oxidase accessory protein NosD, contains tandem CASH domains n=1 Tax=Halopelagius inordinatus TaxID=553467 RepID=A0A1I2MZA6_9EURY|nr:NosD domain-containing protein [Halopelagius inordinatus]SFF96934.1 Nitrous oxidase accessory protein NosD, contains tandem CASH domains [Halopelagius inordinatus]